MEESLTCGLGIEPGNNLGSQHGYEGGHFVTVILRRPDIPSLLCGVLRKHGEFWIDCDGLCSAMLIMRVVT